MKISVTLIARMHRGIYRAILRSMPWVFVALTIPIAARAGDHIVPGKVSPPSTSTTSLTDTDFLKHSATRIAEIAKHPGWLHLLHYRVVPYYSPAGNFSFFESEIDAPQFFLSPRGKSDPEAELTATLLEMIHPQTSTPIDRIKNEPLPPPAACRFPGRRLFLKTFFPEMVSSENSPCLDFENFKQGLSVKSISVIFSTYYINNPSSAFGHSFLRLNRSAHSDPKRSSELLDMGINYAAVIDTSNPFIYAFKGFLGFFPGTFTSIPYFYKVREYNDFESRDLWEYQLELSPSEIDLLVAHIWELGDSFLWYYYLSENCSYHVLSLLQAARPQSALLRNQRQIVIPVDTLRTLFEESDWVVGKSFRQSLWKTAASHYEQLTSSEKTLVFAEMKWIKHLSEMAPAEHPYQLSPTLQEHSDRIEKAAVLDFLLDAIDVYFSKEILKPESPAAHIKYLYQSQRAQFPSNPNYSSGKHLLSTIQGNRPSQRGDTTPSQPSLESDKIFSTSPEQGHGSRRFQLGLSSLYTTTIGYRFSLHDTLDPPKGYPGATTLEMFHFQARLSGSSRLWLEELNLFTIESFLPRAEIRRHLSRSLLSQLSWKAKFGWQRLYDEECSDQTCIGPRLTLGAGYTFAPFSFPLFLSLMPEGALQYSNRFVRTKFLPETGIRFSTLFQQDWGGSRLDFIPTYRWFSATDRSLRLPIIFESRVHLSKVHSLGLTLRWEPGSPRVELYRNQILNSSSRQEAMVSYYFYH